MEKISFNLERFEKPRAGPKTKTSGRAEVIKEIVELINKERIGTQYKPTTGRIVAIKVGHIKDLFSLGWLLQEGKKARSFGEFFFSRLKVKT